MKIGDKVRILTIPPGLLEGEMRTKSLFEECVGRTFPIVGFEDHLLELEVGEVRGEAPYVHSIWIEPDHVELVTTPD
jgi:hypothetical protein